MIKEFSLSIWSALRCAFLFAFVVGTFFAAIGIYIQMASVGWSHTNLLTKLAFVISLFIQIVVWGMMQRDKNFQYISLFRDSSNGI